MALQTQHLPNVLNNIRAAKGWRVQDMVNWHRLVKPLRRLRNGQEGIDLYPLVFDLCTRFSVTYEPFLERLQTRIPARTPSRPGEPRVALFVDAPEHLSGVAVSISSWHNQARQRGLNLTIHTAGSGALPDAVEFAPVGTLKLHNYAGMNLHVPQVREVMDYMNKAGFDMVHVSTPGPMGLLGLMAGRLLGLPVTGTYHTDFPRYAVKLSGDPEVEAGCWKFMRWLYGQMDRVAAPSRATREDLVAHGFDGERITVVGRGVKSDRFHPELRDENLRRQWYPDRPHKLLYVGRVSEEKNLDCLVYAFQQLMQYRDDTALVVVGEGPYLETMKAKLQGFPVVFTGRQTGDELSRIYASCDLFVFPSETDTFGIVLIEAQASGVPVLVSGRGGVSCGMVEGRTGLTVDPMHATHLHRTIHAILEDRDGMAAMRKAARAFAETRTPERSFEAFWNFHRTALHPEDA